MTRAIMNGCNGKMGQCITGICAQDPDIEIVAGIDTYDGIKNDYPVFKSLADCDVEADVIIDFSIVKAVDALIDHCVEKQIPVVLCTTGLSEEQLDKVEKAYEKVAILKSANMSLGINMLLKILKEATEILAPAGFDIEIVEKHHNQKLDAPSGTAIMTADKIDAARKEAGVQPAPHKTHESLDGARGASVDGIPIHSVRLPGYIAHQQVLFGGYGELLTIRHDSMDRKSFMPGVVLAVKKVSSRPGLTFGLENYL